MQIGYLGPENSFTYLAAREAFAHETLVPYPSIPLCIQALVNGVIDRCVVPNENSLEGSVHATIDTLFREQQLSIEKEIILPINHQLVVADRKDMSRQPIKRIISHPQALAQCTNYLNRYYQDAVIEAVASTTTAALYVKNHPEEAVAAIASKEAATAYQLRVEAENIQDVSFNQTRFWVMQHVPATLQHLSDQADKATIFVTLPANQPGSLHKILAAFGWRDIDLSKIESRPSKTTLGEYFFVIDLVVDKPIQLIANAFEEIQLLGGTVHLLGVYPITEKRMSKGEKTNDNQTL
ncbi:prephenate dehydratase [Enterococcus sp. DIV0876]|uniref:prephenate dehydratase n=1 Tax=Enterococcus sp. DIV0876 TaxID=2774633 RepID=UPI003D2FF1EF